MVNILYSVPLFFLLFTSCTVNSAETVNQPSKSLESGFISPPDSIQTSVYWYWISDNISREGVIKDLHAMKEVGINRAFIGNIGIKDLPAGNVNMFTDEWWEIMHLALRTASELGIEIGIFNSPGWSQSGGPWIKPEESMRYLTSSKLEVNGPRKILQKIDTPAGFFQDVKVLAYRIPDTVQPDVNDKNTRISSTPSLPQLSHIVDKNESTSVLIPPASEFAIAFDTGQPFTARSVTVTLAETPAFVNAVFQARNDGGEYRTVSEFEINRSNINLNVGFKPFAPVVISIPTTTSQSFRLVLKDIRKPLNLAEVKISGLPQVERYSEKTLAKMHPTPLPYWDAYLWPEQPEIDDRSLAVRTDQVIDISQSLSADGTLSWEVPEGNWMILRMGMTTTRVTNGPASPEATGLEVDKMSKKWVAEHFDRFIGEIIRKVPEQDRKTFKVVVQDSYETGGQNFTDGFLDEFRERYGYNPIPYLPVFEGTVINNRLESDRFLWDIRRMIADKVAYDYVGGLRDVSHKHGLRTWLENYGHWGFPGEFLMYGGQSDEIGGEFWSEGELGDIENRAATSAGHIYGKNKISAESNTSGGPAYSRYPAKMKQRNDRFFAEGINNTLLHVYIMQPYEDKNPGVNAWFGNEFDRKNTWFSQLDVYIYYLKRVNFMLQQGLNVADVAYFIGEDAPKMTGITNPPLPIGYQFDYINAEVIMRDMKVKDGKLTLPHGTQYKVLVLPKLETMRPGLLKKIKQLVQDGAVVLGPAPSRSPSLQNQPEADREVMRAAAELWADVDGRIVKERTYGKGRIMDGLTLEEVFHNINLAPDCRLPGDNSIHYGHRTMEGMEIYFLSNQTDEEKIINPGFRITGMQPELWDAAKGTIRSLPAFRQEENFTSVPLKLQPYESAFIVFRRPAKPESLNDVTDNYPDPRLIEKLQGPWTVAFDPDRGGPDEPVIFDFLTDWTTSPDDRIKYYSGKAVYTIRFNFTNRPAENVVIDLGSLTSMAKVYVNGICAGGVWTPPYQLEITQLLKDGTNEISIEVVNNWMNRLIGDRNLPEKQRQTWCFVNPYKADSPLQPSGLFGPVVINGLGTPVRFSGKDPEMFQMK